MLLASGKQHLKYITNFNLVKYHNVGTSEIIEIYSQLVSIIVQ